MSSPFPIDRNLSPLDKLASQTQQTIKQNNNNNLSINTVFSSSFHKTPPSSFSLTPLTSNHPHQLIRPTSTIQQQQPTTTTINKTSNRSTFKFNSALSQLTDSLNQLEEQLPVIHPRRPSTGRVNSNTATTQTPREHIPSYYGDQHSIHSNESSTEQPQQPQPQQHQQHQHQHHHQQHLDHEEVLNSSPPSRQQLKLDHHQTRTSSSPSESDSELDAQSTYYPSGLSAASEDPFQYRHYEASRQSRQPLHSSQPSNPPLAPPPAPPAQPINPPTSERSTNFSRPLRQASLTPSNPASSSLASPQTGSPPGDHLATPHACNANRDSESQYSSNGDYLADTRDILTKGRTAQFDSTRSKRSDSKASSLRSLGHAARASIQSRSSIDTTSSKGSRLSWKKLFDFGSSSDQHTATQHNLHSLEPAPHSDPTNSNNLPEIVFSQSDLERSTREHAKEYHHKLVHPPHQMGEPTVDVRPLHQTSYHQSASEDTHGLTPNHHLNPGNKRNHRLSIYSLPSSDDLPPAELPPAELDRKQRYASRSPITFDASDSSQVPSPISDELNPAAARHERAPVPHSQASFQQQQQQPSRPPSSILHYGNSSNGTQLHSAIKKAKATLAVSNPKGFKSQGQSAQDYLQAGIEAHERGDLERSAGLFERAARDGGGCGAGMLMWGLSLRHGWGCQVNEVRAFKWLQKAAESVIEDLDPKATTQPHPASLSPPLSTPGSHPKTPRNGDHDQVAKSELILAIYELGQCFMRGWGCKKDKQLAISYFELAAKLGDPDAQQELGFCYTNGKGTKKDLKLAAKYYRMAAQQGVEMMGTQWIWKEKVMTSSEFPPHNE